jgi:hypothetical protein
MYVGLKKVFAALDKVKSIINSYILNQIVDGHPSSSCKPEVHLFPFKTDPVSSIGTIAMK